MKTAKAHNQELTGSYEFYTNEAGVKKSNVRFVGLSDKDLERHYLSLKKSELVKMLMAYSNKYGITDSLYYAALKPKRGQKK
jgi:hypothetical protein